MRILLSGSSGLIGKAIVNFFPFCGHEVVPLMRRSSSHCSEQPGVCGSRVQKETIFWDPYQETTRLPSHAYFDAVIHLAGENISGRWNKRKKQRIQESRINGTRRLAEAISALTHPPKVFICASAIGIYGNRDARVCNEETSLGTGFLAEVCRQWEAAAAPAVEKGIRTLFLRTGVVLSVQGGALKKMLLPFWLGLGGKVGSGDQYVSWIAIDDVLKIILFLLTHEAISGPVNVVSPHPVTNGELSATLGQVLRRPVFFPLPPFVLKLFLGKEMVEETILSSIRAEPKRLLDASYSFVYPDLKPALEHLLREY